MKEVQTVICDCGTEMFSPSGNGRLYFCPNCCCPESTESETENE